MLTRGVPFEDICDWSPEIQAQLLQLHEAGIIGFKAEVDGERRIRAEIRKLERLVYQLMPKKPSAPPVDSVVPPLADITEEYPTHAFFNIVTKRKKNESFHN